MAGRPSQLPAGRYFATLGGLLVILYLLVFFTGDTRKPKLGLDLQGGTTVTLTARTQNGKAPSRADLNTARNIIENRVNGLGVANSDVVTQGNDQIVISVPGKGNDQAKQLGATAQLYFRPVLAMLGATTATTPTAGGTPTAVPSSGGATATTPSGSVSSGTTSSTGATAGPSAPTTGAPADHPPVVSGSPAAAGLAGSDVQPVSDARPIAGVEPISDAQPISDVRQVAASGAPTVTGPPDTPAGATSPPAANSTPAASSAPGASTTPNASATPSSSASASTLPAGVPASLAGDLDKPCADLAKQDAIALETQPIIACDASGNKYALDKALFKGTEVKGASSGYYPPPQGQGWTITLDLKSNGQTIWAEYTNAHNASATPGAIANYVAFVLDGQVLSAPEIQSTINGETQITGSFTADSSKTLANDFKYGALPLTFTTSNAQTISATLGSSQLKAGLLAGGIGLGLVIIYSLLYYRVLGLITIASLLISGLLVYASIVLLGRHIGFTLTLAGIAGFIVAVGITADSFVVFFERLKEEVHEGRSVRSGVPRAWLRARRTILSADAVSFLAAAILYYLATGEVRGFAFTLGLSTILDLVVVFSFTHPLVSVASRARWFSHPRMTGLRQLRAPLPSGPSARERAAARRDRLAKES